MRRLLAVAVAAALAASGCGLRARAPQPGPREGEWGKIRFEATRRAAIYDGLVHRATTTVTHLGFPEREARARRLGEWLGWTPAELEARLAAERAEAAEGEEFLVSLYTAERRVNDLDSPRSVWRIAVAIDGAELLPRRIEAVDPDATLTGLFPYVGTFDTVYRVQFPPAPGGPLSGRPFVLILASALGKATLDYGVPNDADGDKPLEPTKDR